MIGGVCGGLAEYFDLDVSLVRLVFVGIALVSLVLPMLVFYVVAWAVIPGPSASPPKSPPGPPIPA
jgi:phage shock protein C